MGFGLGVGRGGVVFFENRCWEVCYGNVEMLLGDLGNIVRGNVLLGNIKIGKRCWGIILGNIVEKWCRERLSGTFGNVRDICLNTCCWEMSRSK